jgi:hypothetical protein
MWQIHDFDWLRKVLCLFPTPNTFITMGQLEIEFQYWNNVGNVGKIASKADTNLCLLYMIFIVVIQFINCLAGLMRQWISHWNRANRQFNGIALAGNNLWKRQTGMGF